jgi:hypothetical protein
MTQPTQLRIRTAAELLAALEDPEPGVRMAVLQVVARQPARALAYGRHEGRDVVDVLLAQAAGRERRGVWEVVIATLAVFDDPRIVELFLHLLATGRRAETLFTAANRLEREPIEPLVDRLLPLLMQNESDARARAAARLLLRASGLDRAAQLRTALLAGDGRLLPAPLDADTLELWLAELDGLFALRARRALEAQGEPALRLLAPCWDRLRDDDRRWLVEWAARTSLDVAATLCERALASGSTALTLAALAVVPRLGERAAALAPHVAPLAAADDPKVRLAAVRAGTSGIDVRRMLTTERAPTLRRACLAALARDEGAAALPDLVAALRDRDCSAAGPGASGPGAGPRPPATRSSRSATSPRRPSSRSRATPSPRSAPRRCRS